MKTYTAILASLTLAGASAVFAGDNAGALAHVNPDTIEGKDVFDSAGQQLGDVDEIVINKSNHRLAVIGLEDSTKEVAVPINKLAMSADGKSLRTSMTRAQLESLPDYDPMDMESADE